MRLKVENIPVTLLPWNPAFTDLTSKSFQLPLKISNRRYLRLMTSNFELKIFSNSTPSIEIRVRTDQLYNIISFIPSFNQPMYKILSKSEQNCVL